MPNPEYKISEEDWDAQWITQMGMFTGQNTKLYDCPARSDNTEYIEVKVGDKVRKILSGIGSYGMICTVTALRPFRSAPGTS